MAMNKELFIDQYIAEETDILSRIETIIFDIKDGNSKEDNLIILLRHLHTLKGTSRMLEFNRIAELTHSLESVFEAIRDKKIEFSDNTVKFILSVLDLLKTGFIVIQDTKNDAIEISDYIKNLSLLAANREYTLPITESSSSEIKNTDEKEKDLIQPSENKTQSDTDNKTTVAEKHKEAKSESIRLSLDKIDKIIKNTISLYTLETEAKSLSQYSGEIVSLIKYFSILNKEQKIFDSAQSVNFRRLEKICKRLNSSLKNYVIDTGNSIRTSYDSVISLRTFPISTIFDSYPRFVYQLSQELGKKVQLTIEGRENEIDKNIIETISEALMHMIRNSIDHGIETPQERLDAGKNEAGKLSIVCSSESGNIKIIISDDGRGINTEKIRQRIVKDGLVDETLAANLSKDELINFIFESGFSTSGTVSNISGRGVGMDVVRDCIESLKGSINVNSTEGEGTKFTIIVPLSIAALMGFPAECHGMKFIIPSTFVEAVLLINRNDIITVVDRPEIKYDDRIIKLFYLNQILDINKDPVDLTDTVFVVIIRSYEDILALAVNNIDGMKSFILKTLPAFMEKMSVFSGIVLNEDYEMVSVLHIPTVIKMAKQIKNPHIGKNDIESKIRKTVLVVDDSLPTREIESEILLSEGYHVDTSADGAQALKAAESKHYDLICTDLNMPVMDGFTLIENLKKNKELSRIPIIVISSKDDKEEQKRAFALGASKYIIKNSFNNHNMLEAVNSLIGAAL
jgi:chemotaxis protein histidine kinase CheA